MDECEHSNLSAYAVTSSLFCVRLKDGEYYYETNRFSEVTVHVTCDVCGMQWEEVGCPPRDSEKIPDNVRRIANEVNYQVYCRDRRWVWN